MAECKCNVAATSSAGESVPKKARLQYCGSGLVTLINHQRKRAEALHRTKKTPYTPSAVTLTENMSGVCI